MMSNISILHHLSYSSETKYYMENCLLKSNQKLQQSSATFSQAKAQGPCDSRKWKVIEISPDVCSNWAIVLTIN